MTPGDEHDTCWPLTDTSCHHALTRTSVQSTDSLVLILLGCPAMSTHTRYSAPAESGCCAEGMSIRSHTQHCSLPCSPHGRHFQAGRHSTLGWPGPGPLHEPISKQRHQSQAKNAGAKSLGGGSTQGPLRGQKQSTAISLEDKS
eukprot:1158145-Pelagomonas_calceolata.AAC.2